MPSAVSMHASLNLPQSRPGNFGTFDYMSYKSVEAETSAFISSPDAYRDARYGALAGQQPPAMAARSTVEFMGLTSPGAVHWSTSPDATIHSLPSVPCPLPQTPLDGTSSTASYHGAFDSITAPDADGGLAGAGFPFFSTTLPQGLPGGGDGNRAVMVNDDACLDSYAPSQDAWPCRKDGAKTSAFNSKTKASSPTSSSSSSSSPPPPPPGSECKHPPSPSPSSSGTAITTAAARRSSGRAGLSLRTTSRKPRNGMHDGNLGDGGDEFLTLEERLARQNHNRVEKKYRDRLNVQFERLLAALPADRLHGDGPRDDGADDPDSSGEKHITKAKVLDIAHGHIKALEAEKRGLEEENRGLASERKRLQVERRRLLELVNVVRDAGAGQGR